MVEIFSIFFITLVTIGCAYLVFSKNVMRSLVVFASLMLLLAAIFAVNTAEYVAVVQILVYAGGIVILLAFSIMFTKPGHSQKLITPTHFILPAVLLVFLLAGGFFSIFWSVGNYQLAFQNSQTLVGIGHTFFTQYLLVFETVGFILLLVLVGSAYLSKKSKWQ